MLVRALLLRHRGVPIDPSLLRKAIPLSGELIYTRSQYEGRDGRGRMTAILMPVGMRTTPQIELFSARIVKVEVRGMLITGEEEEWERKVCRKYRQTLWAWPHGPGQDDKLRQKPELSTQARDFLAEIEALA